MAEFVLYDLAHARTGSHGKALSFHLLALRIPVPAAWRTGSRKPLRSPEVESLRATVSIAKALEPRLRGIASRWIGRASRARRGSI